MTTEQKHTKGPWVASRCENEKEWGIDSGEWGVATCADYPGDGTPEANARRIVACVNACEGVDNETLEKIASGEMTGSEIWELPRVKAERDALAAKVKELEAQQAEAIHCLKYIKQCLNDGIGIDALKDYRIDETLAKIEIGVSK